MNGFVGAKSGTAKCGFDLRDWGLAAILTWGWNVEHKYSLIAYLIRFNRSDTRDEHSCSSFNDLSMCMLSVDILRLCGGSRF